VYVRRTLFTWRGIRFHAYPTLLYVGLVLGVFVGHAAARDAGLDADRTTAATLLLIVPALAGSRLFYVLLHWRLYRHHRRRMWSRDEGGAAMYGGFLLALAVSVPLTRLFGLRWGAFWDAGMLTILTGMIPTRLGCLLNGCCGGRPSASRVAVRLPNVRGDWQRRLPLQVFEAAWAAVLLAGLVAMWPARPFEGALLLAGAAGYSAARLVFEPLREDTDRVGTVRVHSAISAGLVAASLSALAALWPVPPPAG
jgi:prolipoprotein diacylglyceryltransferase